MVQTIRPAISHLSAGFVQGIIHQIAQHVKMDLLRAVLISHFIHLNRLGSVEICSTFPNFFNCATWQLTLLEK